MSIKKNATNEWGNFIVFTTCLRLLLGASIWQFGDCVPARGLWPNVPEWHASPRDYAGVAA